MSVIYLDDGTTLKSFKASATEAKATVDVRFEIRDPSDLGFFLRGLKNIQERQREAAKPAPAPKRPKARKALAAPLLQIPYLSGDDE